MDFWLIQKNTNIWEWYCDTKYASRKLSKDRNYGWNFMYVWIFAIYQILQMLSNILSCVCYFAEIRWHDVCVKSLFTITIIIAHPKKKTCSTYIDYSWFARLLFYYNMINRRICYISDTAEWKIETS